MKKNRFLALALSLLMALALPLGAFAEENEPDTLLEGLVTEVLEQGFVMEDIELGSVLLNVDETTVMDGILAEGDIEVGQYVFVEYDGRLTRSLPPQAHADRVGCYRLTGTVDLSLSMGVLLTGDPTFGDVIIRVDGSMPHLYQGMPITVYYNGVMAMSYPGQVTARHIVVPELTGVVSDRDSAGFTLTDADELVIKYRATTNKKTVINLTHHGFFSLAGIANPTPTIDNVLLEVNADHYLPIDDTSIPTGEIRQVEGTPFDFRTMKPVAQDIEADDEQLRHGAGYDHCFVLNKHEEGELTLAARVKEPTSGRTMTVYTTEPGVQLYTDNWADGYQGQHGATFPRRSAICLECQHFPDSPNHPYFPSVMLNPGEEYTQKTIYQFGVEK